jgi:outer membrane protein
MSAPFSRSFKNSVLSIAIGSCLVAGVSTSALATTLAEIWQATQQESLELKSLKANLEVSKSKHEQSKALWRPSVFAKSMAGKSTYESQIKGAEFSAPAFGTMSGADFNTSINNGNATQISIVLQQPLFNPERLAQSRQLSLAAQLTEVATQAGINGVLIKTIEQYFQLALASQRVAVLEQQASSSSASLIEAKDRFQLGASPITDSLEAQARNSQVQAQLLQAKNQLQSIQNQMARTSRLNATQLNASVDAVQKELLSTKTLAAWTSLALEKNLGLQQQRLSLKIADQELSKTNAISGLQINLVGMVSQEKNSGNGDYGSASQKANQYSLGVQASIPLYTGGYTQAKYKENLALVEQATLQTALLEQQVTEQVEQAWRNLGNNQLNIQALEQALKANKERLGATQLGKQVGHRTTLDLLNAQNDLAQSELALAQAKLDSLSNQIQLLNLTGQINEEVILSIASR